MRGWAVKGTIGSVLGLAASTASAASAEQAPNIALFVLIVMGCVALVLLRRRA
jgi:hypothetical protein